MTRPRICGASDAFYMNLSSMQLEVIKLAARTSRKKDTYLKEAHVFHYHR